MSSPAGSYEAPPSSSGTAVPAQPLGLWSGVGLVISNMVGVGVLTSTGFMARDLGPKAILAVWVLGGLVAMAGARAYAALAAMIPRSGGEYRYLSELVHPAAGYLAGWTSLLVGFSAPIALGAAAAGAFASTIVPGIEPRVFGSVLIVALTALHALAFSWSRITQNVLASAKAVALIGFVGLGLLAGRHQLPVWSPPAGGAGTPIGPFMIALVYVAYAYSGWNTAVYAAEEFREPQRTVPRALLVGSTLVTGFYVLVNAVLVANLEPTTLSRWAAGDTQRITLGHLLVVQLAGPVAGNVMSVVIILALVSMISSMVLVGPRVASAMAREGFLPARLAGSADHPPTLAVVLQSSIALLLLGTHSFELLLRNVGAILTLSAAATVASLFRVRFGHTRYPKPGLVPLLAAGLFIAMSAWMLWFAFRDSWTTVAWTATATALAGIGYGLTRLRQR